MNIKRAEYFVSGIVQGVGFRYFVYKNAMQLGLNGYAKNLPDGRVEVVAEGNEESIKNIQKILKQGPSFSRVDKLHVRYTEAQNEFKEFNIY